MRYGDSGELGLGNVSRMRVAEIGKESCVPCKKPCSALFDQATAAPRTTFPTTHTHTNKKQKQPSISRTSFHQFHVSSPLFHPTEEQSKELTSSSHNALNTLSSKLGSTTVNSVPVPVPEPTAVELNTDAVVSRLSSGTSGTPIPIPLSSSHLRPLPPCWLPLIIDCDSESLSLSNEERGGDVERREIRGGGALVLLMPEDDEDVVGSWTCDAGWVYRGCGGCEALGDCGCSTALVLKSLSLSSENASLSLSLSGEAEADADMLL